MFTEIDTQFESIFFSSFIAVYSLRLRDKPNIICYFNIGDSYFYLIFFLRKLKYEESSFI